MKLEDLDFAYPERLIATEPVARSRVMVVQGGRPSEVADGVDGLLASFRPGDLLVLNDTRVVARRVFTLDGLEILFLGSLDRQEWEVLCPSSRWKDDEQRQLPDGVDVELIARGKPQRVRVSRPLNDEYFEVHGDLPLPPYIQKARGERRNRAADRARYQTAWAEVPGSLAAPTASLHFRGAHLEKLRAHGVAIEKITLHVGLGTFLPITTPRLEDHVMHLESVHIPSSTWEAVERTRARGGRVWALGTTVTRSLESVAAGVLLPGEDGTFRGDTDLFIRPGFSFHAVDVLCTNFHQPKSTLLALVAAFAGLETVRTAYEWAIEREFRLFSYGDLSVWTSR